MKKFLPSFAAASILIGSGFYIDRVDAGDWPQFRGPNFEGSAAADESGLPEKFSRESGVKWTADMPGPAASTPAVWGDKVFVTSTNVDTQDLEAICLNRETGEVLWKREVGFGMNRDKRSNFASNSPATDGERVVFFFGTGDLAAFDLDGKPLWQRNIVKDYGEFAFLWTFSTSPLLYKNKLYLQVLQRDTAVNGRGKPEGNESYLLAMDPATGKELWKVNRPAKAQKESLEAFTTPTPFSGAGRDELIIAGGDCLTGHDPETGAEIWRWGTWNPDRITHWRLVPSPVVGGGVVLACAPKKSPVYAIKTGADGPEVPARDWLAQSSRLSPEIAISPVPSAMVLVTSTVNSTPEAATAPHGSPRMVPSIW